MKERVLNKLTAGVCAPSQPAWEPSPVYDPVR